MAGFRSYMNLPPIPGGFRWTDEPWGAGLRCVPLERVANHVFTTRQLALTSEDDRLRLAGAIGARRALILAQVHGATVAVVRRGDVLPAEPPQADAVVSDDPNVAIVARAADCVPMLFADRRTGAVAAVHAGWRGTAAGVAVAAVKTLAREFGTEATDLVVAVGPSIGSCCYEVGTELVDAFAAAGHARYLIDRWFAARPPARGSRDVPKLRLNVAAANRDLLVLEGVPESQIHDVGLCTAMHLGVLTSYRAEKAGAGRIAGAIRARG
jgi:YfiH family protein